MKKQLIVIGSILFSMWACQAPQEKEKVQDKKIAQKTDKEPIKITPQNHDEVMMKVLGMPKKAIKTVGILVYDGVNDLDFAGPKYVLGQLMGAKTQLIALKAGNIKTVMGTEIVPNTVIDSVKQLDILIIPGGFKGTIHATYDQKLHDWIRKIDEKTTYTASVCTGGWVLAATGLLKGKKATTNWYHAEDMLKKYGATFVDKRYVQDGKYWTSAGVTAGMDMSLAIMQDIWGDNYTQAIMLDMEYNPAPPITGGTPAKTDKDVFAVMEAMYSMGITPLMDSLDKAKTVPNK